MALTDNCLAYWTLDNTLTDATGNGNTLTNNGATYTTSGKINGAYNFDGNNDYLSRNSFLSGQSFSFSVWVKFDTLAESTGINSIIGYRIDTGNFNWKFITVSNAGVATFYIRAGAGTLYAVTGTTTITTGNWFHIVGTFDGTVGKLYINNNLEDTETGTPGTFGATGIAIGTQLGRLTDYTDGIIDEVGVWTRALTAAEVTELYNSGNGLQYPFSSVTESFNVIQIGDNL
jgi:hypothetical protein